jgi:hypothetical protein
LSLLNVGIFALTRRFRLFRFVQLLLSLVLPFLMMVALGGFVSGSATILWSLIAPLAALVVAGRRQAALWFLAFLGLVLFSGFLEPAVRPTRDVPLLVQTVFFVMNIGGVSAVAFVLLSYFGAQKDKLRDLERAYLQQELRMARDIQQSLLPNNVPELEGAPEVSLEGYLAERLGAVPRIGESFVLDGYNATVGQNRATGETVVGFWPQPDRIERLYIIERPQE